jgi:hypothetical protein
MFNNPAPTLMTDGRLIIDALDAYFWREVEHSTHDLESTPMWAPRGFFDAPEGIQLLKTSGMMVRDP